MRAGVLAALALGLLGSAGCTFPTVDYAEDGGSCAAPPACASAATMCATAADGMQMQCLKDCKGKPTCPTTCAAMLQGELTSCATTCKGCAAAMCGSAVTNCDALVGL